MCGAWERRRKERTKEVYPVVELNWDDEVEEGEIRAGVVRILVRRKLKKILGILETTPIIRCGNEKVNNRGIAHRHWRCWIPINWSFLLISPEWASEISSRFVYQRSGRLRPEYVLGPAPPDRADSTNAGYLCSLGSAVLKCKSRDYSRSLLGWKCVPGRFQSDNQQRPTEPMRVEI